MRTVLFDPGYSACLAGISDSIELMYGAFQTTPMPLKQKKFQFSMILPKIKDMVLNNVSFYLGCLLWASYIKNFKNAEIINNPCLNTEYTEENSIEEPLYLIDFIETRLDKDSRYYINKKYEKDERFINILKTYIEFIKLNKGFVEIKTTDELILPSNIKPLDKDNLNLVKSKIDEAIKNKKFSLLFDVYSLILD